MYYNYFIFLSAFIFFKKDLTKSADLDAFFFPKNFVRPNFFLGGSSIFFNAAAYYTFDGDLGLGRLELDGAIWPILCVINDNGLFSIFVVDKGYYSSCCMLKIFFLEVSLSLFSITFYFISFVSL